MIIITSRSEKLQQYNNYNNKLVSVTSLPVGIYLIEVNITKTNNIDQKNTILIFANITNIM